jgi:hypothetical protein
VSSSKTLLWLGVGYLLLGLVVAALALADVEVLDLYRDPSELSVFLGDHPWKGGLTVVGAFVWSAAATVFLFAGAVLRSSGERNRSPFFLATGALLLLLGLDDGLAVHESIAPIVLHTDRADKLVQLVLVLLIAAWTWRFRREIRASNFTILLLAGLGLGLGLALDARDQIGLDYSWGGLFEETVEFAGLLTLLVYAAGETWRALAGHRY